MMQEGNDEMTRAALLHDPDRPPGFERQGEVLQVNPEAYKKWLQWDAISADEMYIIATTEEEYEEYQAAPADEVSKTMFRTPVDLLLMGPKVTLLHEVCATPIWRLDLLSSSTSQLFHSVPFGSLRHGPDMSSGWRYVVLGEIDQEVEKWNHPGASKKSFQI